VLGPPQYNILKLNRHLFTYDADAQLADAYERALFNGLVGNLNLDAPFNASGGDIGFIYFDPTGGAGLQKPWGSSLNDGFPCCWGTSTESFAKLSDSIYFRSAPTTTTTTTQPPALFINLYVASSVQWGVGGSTTVTISQSGGFPESADETTVVTVSTPQLVAFSLMVRVPYWALGTIVIAVNGVPQPVDSNGAPPSPSNYFNVTRSWADGDTVAAWFEPTLRWEPLNDWRSQFAGVGAIMFGGVLLTGVTQTEALDAATPQDVLSSIVRTSGGGVSPMRFAMPTPCGNVSMLPMMDVRGEAYAVYWRIGAIPVINYNSSVNGVSAIPTDASMWVAGGGASVLPNGPTMNIRSGDPGELTVASNVAVLQDGSHSIAALNFSYQYVSGYGPAGRHVGANFTLVTTDACGASGTTLYSSPELTQYPYDVCQTCYSPPVNVTLRFSPPLDATQPVALALRFANNDRNVQINLPLTTLAVQWT